MTVQRLTKVYAGGAWVDSSARSTIPVINPATEELVAEVTEGSAQDAELAVVHGQAQPRYGDGVGAVALAHPVERDHRGKGYRPIQKEPLRSRARRTAR